MCSHCARDIGVGEDGTLHKHGTVASGLCAGSHERPVDVRSAEWVYKSAADWHATLTERFGEPKVVYKAEPGEATSDITSHDEDIAWLVAKTLLLAYYVPTEQVEALEALHLRSKAAVCSRAFSDGWDAAAQFITTGTVA